MPGFILISMEIKEKEHKEKFCDEFLERYSRRGFGSMNKNDFEVLIFDLLRKYGNCAEKTNHESSLLLQIPETKIRKLAYEADLRYGNLSEKDVKVEFFRVIAKSKFRAAADRIQFVIENRYVRTSISAHLKFLGHYSDSSFNSEIISIHVDSFIDLLNDYYPEASIERILSECKKSVEAQGENKISFKGIMKKFFEGVATQAGKKTVNIGTMLFTGGAENVSELIENINEKLSESK